MRTPVLWCARLAGAVGIVATLIAPAGAASAQEAGGAYLDADGERVLFARTYREQIELRTREPSLVSAGLWATALLATGLASYWLAADRNRVDWDFPDTTERLRLSAMSLDNNPLKTNALHHPFSGTGYYGLSRVSGLSVAESFFVSFLASGLWEYALEWREKMSINDLVFTPLGGLPLGEALFQLGEYVHSAPDGGGWAQDVAAVTLGFPRFVQDRFTTPRARPPLAEDELGLSSAYSHRFRLAWDVASLSNDRGDGDIVQGGTAEMLLTAIPGFLRPGTIDLGFDDGNVTRARVSALFDEQGSVDLALRHEAILAGRFHQELSEDLHGFSGLLGISVAYDYRASRLLDRRDELGVAHLFGPAWDVRIGLGGPWIVAQGRVHADFAAVRSHAWSAWSTVNGGERVRSVLENRGYYFALGLSGRLELALEYDALRAEASLGYGHYRSLDGLDREQDLVTSEPALTDGVLELGGRLELAPPRGLVSLSVAWDQLSRSSEMGSVTVDRSDRRWTFSLGARF